MHNHRRFSISLVVIITTVVGIFAGLSATPTVNAFPNPITWATKTSIPFATGQTAVIGGLDGRIYVIGGYTGSTQLSTASAYDPRYDTWSSIAPEPYPTRGSGIALGKNGLIYVISGCCTYVSNLQIYNATSNAWTSGAAIPQYQWMPGATTGSDGRIYVAGGYYGYNLLQIYNPTSNTWTTGASMPTGRIQFSLVAAPNGLLYAIGGMTTSYAATNAVDAYNITSNTWTSKAPMPAAVNEYGATLGPDGLIYVFGGSNNFCNDCAPYYNTVYSYFPPTNTWYTNTQNLPTARKEESAATSIYNHRIYVVGGANTNGYVSTNEEATVSFGDPTTTTVMCTPSAVLVNNPTSCNATVTDTNSTGTLTPTGNVTFTSGSTGTFGGTCTLTGSGASASCTANVTYTPTVVTPGTHVISGTYNGDAKHAFSTSTGSQSFSLTVTGRSTSAAVSCTPSTVVINNGSTCTATLTDTASGTPSIPTGTVIFTKAGTAAGALSPASCNLVSGSCSVTFTPAAAGSDTVTGNYQGDNVHSISSGTSGAITSTLRTSSIGISCPSSTIVNSHATCTVTVTDTSPIPTVTPTGTIIFTTNSTGTFTTCTLSGFGASATCTTNYSPTTTGTGSHRLTAYYGGDSAHYAASPNATATVKVNVRSISSTIACSSSSATIGVPINCTIIVTDNSPGTPTTPTGIVTLTTTGSGSFVGTCTLAGTAASASCTISYSAGGTGASNDVITYTYPGDTNHTTSTASLLLPVNPATTTPGVTNTSPSSSFPTYYWIILAVPVAIGLASLGYFMSLRKRGKQQNYQPFSDHATLNPSQASPQPAANTPTTFSPPFATAPQGTTLLSPAVNPQPAASQQPATSSTPEKPKT